MRKMNSNSLQFVLEVLSQSSFWSQQDTFRKVLRCFFLTHTRTNVGVWLLGGNTVTDAGECESQFR